MNVKRISVFAGTVGTLALTSVALADMSGLSYDIVSNGGLIGDYYTARVYADVAVGDRLDAVAGNENNTLMIMGSFYQDALGGPTSTSINSAFFPLAPSLEWDSYVTIGALHSDGYPFASNGLNDVGIDWSNFESGGDLVANNGTWFVTPDMVQGEELDGRVLVAQLSIMNGTEAYFGGLFQGKDSNGDTWQGAAGVTIAVPAPGAVALLGLAGLAGRRRRRA